MDKELRKEFVEMLEHERNTPTGWAIIMTMVDMLADDDELERLAETHKGMQEYGQFLTEKAKEQGTTIGAIIEQLISLAESK